MAEEYDFLFKSIVVGDGGVGKTALTLRFSKGFFTEDYKMTIGVDFHVKTIELDTKDGPIHCKLQLWDTGGQERFSSIRPMYYRGSLGAVLVFDLTNSASFEHLPQWIEEVRANIKAEIPLLLVGNKSDLMDQRMISIDQINQFTEDFNLYYMETSAKTGDGVGDCFYILACLMIGQGVPEQLIANKTVFSPGQIALTVPTVSLKPQVPSGPQYDYVAPPVPEPETPKKSAPVKPLKEEPKFEYEAPPVPEPQQTTVDEQIEMIEEEPEFEFEAPPVPEPIIEPQKQPKIRTPETTEIEFKTPDEILSQVNTEKQEESKVTPFSIPTESSPPETYKPKSIPFSSKAISPVPAPEGFSKPIKSTKKEEISKPFSVSKRDEPIKPKPASMRFEPAQEIPPKESSSQSLVDYMPHEMVPKKKKKHLLKQKKKQEKEEKLKIQREKQEQLIDAMKKSKKEKKDKKNELKREKSEEIGAPSLFQTLSQRIDDTTEEIASDNFIPFSSPDDSFKEESSTLRIIPNVADIETEPSSFTAFTPTQTETEQPESQKSKELLVCKQCGATLSSDYAFCNKCGSKL
ncbi:MAG: GTP-binding protein [Promethearchaeota archaeon]|nr:MAG: GTP-binding protein [Candidatus Lokiarchaeota archaeon]